MSAPVEGTPAGSSGSGGVVPPPAPPTYTREELHGFANAMMKEMQTDLFRERVRTHFARDPVPRSPDELLDRYEAEQIEFYATRCPPEATLPRDGAAVLSQLRTAIKAFPDKETERIITQLCVLEETQMTSVTATVPQLQSLMSSAPSSGHAHGGAGSSHGHSHNGQPCHGHGGGGSMQLPFQPTPQMAAMMEMAMQTLSVEEKATLERVQKTMIGGSPPTPQDMQKMFMIQQKTMAFMQTMEKFMGGGGKAPVPPGKK